METNVLFKSIVEEVGNIFPPDIREMLDIEVREVVKHNDTKLHGLTITKHGDSVSPMMYLEDCIPEFEDGRSIKEIAANVVAGYIAAIEKTPDIDSISLEYGDIKGKLILELADAELNRERLKTGVYKSVGNGLVVIPYVTVKDGPDGTCRFMITKDMAQAERYDIDRLFKDAMENTMRKNEPVLEGMAAKLMMPMLRVKDMNPLSKGFSLQQDEMYVLSNESGQLGAVVLFYPEMQKRLGELVGMNYYVLPSSTHEVIIVPDRGEIGLNEFIGMVKGANRDVVAPKDVLSDRVFKFDIERNKLYEPAALERRGDERSMR